MLERLAHQKGKAATSGQENIKVADLKSTVITRTIRNEGAGRCVR